MLKRIGTILCNLWRRLTGRKAASESGGPTISGGGPGDPRPPV